MLIYPIPTHVPFKVQSVMFGSNSLRCLGAHIWNTLPENIKKKQLLLNKLKNLLTIGMDLVVHANPVSEAYLGPSQHLRWIPCNIDGWRL